MEEKIVTLTTCSFHQAQVLQNYLIAEGIDCFLQNVDTITGADSPGVDILVKESDLPGAMRVINAIDFLALENLHAKKIGRAPKPRILLPVDFSDYSDKASEIALDLAVKLLAEIMVLHVYFNPVVNALPFSDTYVYDAGLDEMVTDIESKAENDMKIFLDKFTRSNLQAGGENVVVKHKLVSGVAEEEILRLSREYMPTVIIMGTRGRDRKSVDLIGSVTAEVIELSRFPVLAVPEDYHYEGLGKMTSMLYAANFDEADFKSLDKLDKFLRPLNAKIFFVRVGTRDENELNKIKLNNLKNYFEEKFTGSRVECDVIENDDFWDGLESYIQHKKIDVVSLTTRRRNLITRLLSSSIGNKVLFHANTPVLVFQA